MIVSIFNAGYGKASNATKYLFGSDKDGNARNPKPAIFDGDRELTEFLIDKGSGNRKFKYTSGVISFRNNERPTDEKLREITKSFREIFCPGMPEDRVNLLWVRHEDKGNIELHFICPMVDMKTMRRFNINPPGRHAQQLQKDFSAYWNRNLGYEQVMEDPIKASFSQFDTKTLDGSKNKARKERLSYEIAKRIKIGRINNRDELIKFLNEKDFEVTRKGKDYLSIKMPGKEKAIKFKGGCFVEGADYKDLVKKSGNTRKTLTQDEYNQVVKRINCSIQFRHAFNEKRYTLKKRMPKIDYKPYGKSQPHKEEIVKLNRGLKATRLKVDVPQANFRGTRKPKSIQNFGSLGSSAINLATGNSFEKLLINISSLENRIFALGQQLLKAPISQRSVIEIQLGELKQQLIRLQQELEEARKAELNKSGLNNKEFRI